MQIEKLRSPRLRALAAFAALAMFATACGGDDGGDDAGGETTADDTADDAAGDDETDDGGDDGATDDGGEASGDLVGVSLILKNQSNPFFVSMAESAQAEADVLGVDLTVAAGREDGDSQSQIDAIESAIARGDAGILITPVSSDVNPALESAREAGLLTIALDTPPEPADVVDITFATDNTQAGVLIGQWAAATLGGEQATIAMLDLFNDQVVSVDTSRDQGFLIGMGIIESVDPSGNGWEPPTGDYSFGDVTGPYEVVCHEPTNGAVDGGRTAMETCLAANPNINVVYTINEPAAQGAFEALNAAGISIDDVLLVSVDGGCDPGLRLVADGTIGATAQQYPGRMATLGMEAIVDLAQGGEAPEPTPGLDFFNTGVELVTDSPVDAVDSLSVEEGLELCWG